MKQPLLRYLALVLGLLLRLVPARAQVLPGTFSAGLNHSLSIHADGTLWATGNNTYGQLGFISGTPNSTDWVQVGSATDWVMVVAGGAHSLGLRADGALYAWGNNYYGQLGNATNVGINSFNSTPTRVGTDRYKQIAANGLHSLALRADGALYAWGNNSYGQLGSTLNTDNGIAIPTPTRVGTDLYQQVAAGDAHTLALRADGALYAWGSNFYGQLGNATNAGIRVPNPTPTRVGTALYTQITAGNGYSLGLRTDGSLYTWGNNYSGQLGYSTNRGTSNANPVPTRVGTTSYKQVASSGSHTLALRVDGSLGAWGANDYGQLVGGPRSMEEATPIYVQVAAGGSHSLGLQADGTLDSWGSNRFGQLGGGTPLSDDSFAYPNAPGTALPTRSTAAGANFGLAVRADGTLWAWGNNTYGQLGNGTTTSSLLPVQIGTARNWVQVVAGAGFSLGLRADGTLYAWGANDYGQLGNATNAGTNSPTPTPTRVGTDLYTQVAAGASHSLALRADGTLWAWGYNVYGQLGNATRTGTNSPTPTPTQVGTERYTHLAAGFQHSLGLRADGTLWAWGYNISGQLGNGGTNVVNAVPTQVGTALYTQAAAGGYHSLGLRPDGTLYGWGANYNGQLGDGPTGDNTSPNLTPRQAGTGTYTYVAAGQYHSLGLRPDGSLYTWGSNTYGQLGNGTADTDVRFINATPTQEATASTKWASLGTGSTSLSSVVRTASGLTFASTGLNSSGQLGDGTTGLSKRFDRLRPLGTAQPLPVLAAGPTSLGLGLYPNPGRTTALHGAAPGGAVQVLDALGRQVLAATADATGTAQLRLPATLAPGVYLVRTGRQALRLSVE